jgi:hypothetical protein
MEDLTAIFQRYMPQAQLEQKSEFDGTFVYEFSNVPASRSQRSVIINNILSNLQSSEDFKEYFITKKASVTVDGKSYKSGDGNTPLILVIKENARRASKTLAILKLIPRPKFKIKPKDLGITKNGKPYRESSYLSFDEVIERIEGHIDQFVNDEKISDGMGEWVKIHLAMFNPKDLTTGKRQRIREVWNNGLMDEITSELLEVFCGLGYIKAITTPFYGQGAILSVNPKEKKRVLDIVGDDPPIDSFKIWFPEQANFPIIDSQVGYFENGQLKAAFPISTKNVTGGRLPNVIKFGDIFTNKKQVLKWKNNLPKKSGNKQGIQTVVAAQAVGQPSRQGALYPLYASKSILNSRIPNLQNKRYFLTNINEYGSHFSDHEIRDVLDRLTRVRHSKTERLNEILDANSLRVAKELVYILLFNTRGTSSPYSQVVQRFEKEYLLTISEDVWNSVVKGRGSAEYPYTYQNISLFFEKVLENNSVHRNGQTNYLRMVVENYFTANRALIAKYDSESPPSGAGDVILSKVSIGQDGIARISYNTRTNPATNYGLRSKNSLNNLQDALGITP